ncbi:MAG: class I SAM-dependent methyltransferase [Rhodospirillales bacterium]
MRGFRRRLSLGLPTVLGLAGRGFFIPYRYAGADPGPRRRPPYAAIAAMMATREDAFRDLLAVVDGYADDLLAIGAAPPPAPRWRQDWFPRLDAACAYALLRQRRPGRLVEVGAGHSTRFFARAVADGGHATRIVVIDPAPRADLGGLAIEILRGTLQRVGEAPFAALAAGDVLSIDSSHILMPGTDVDTLLNRVLPALPSGVLVQVHDVFLPDDYPPTWSWRGYNEQLAVAPLLLGGGWRPLWSSRYVTTRMTAALDGTVVAHLPLAPNAFEASLWIEKV